MPGTVDVRVARGAGCNVCERPHYARGWCKAHYENWRRTGTAVITRPSILERLCRLTIVEPSGCWEWQGAKSNGYGRIKINGAPVPAHRVMYEQLAEPIPPGLELDHLCRNHGCVNPAHLEPVTGHENLRRAGAAITHCPQGHAYDEANTFVTARGHRLCRACRRDRERARRAA